MDLIHQLKDHLKEINDIEDVFLQYIEANENENKLLLQLNNKISNINEKELNLFLHLISEIANNHYRPLYFFERIQQIFKELKNYINQYSDDEIYKIFKDNKRILLILIEEKIIEIDYFLRDNIDLNYFIPEITLLDPESRNQLYELYELYGKPYVYNPETYLNDQELFEKNRRNGTNDSIICQFIQKDSIDEFIIYVNKKNISLDSIIKSSEFETNQFLLKNSKISLIEYATFYGSIQIFNYLRSNNVKLTPSLWLYAIHSNPEIIQILDDNQIQPKDKTFEECLIESIKCHHIEITNYILDNLLLNKDDKSYLHYIIISYNFIALSQMLDDESFDFYDWSIIDENAQKKGFYIFYDFFYCNYHVIIDFLINNAKILMIYQFESVVMYGKEYSQYKIKNYLLTYAIKKNNIEMTQKLISKCGNYVNTVSINFDYGKFKWSNDYYDVNTKLINYKTEDTALTLAVKNNNLEITKLLLSIPNIDVNFISKGYHYNETALAIAIRYNIEIAKLLLSNPNIDVNIKSIIYNREESPLFIAVRSGSLEIIDLLLKNPTIDVNSISIIQNREKTALGYAFETETIEIIKLLLDQPSIDPNPFIYDKVFDKYEPILVNLIRKNNNEMIKLILNNQNINKNTSLCSALPFALYFDNMEIFNLLLSIDNIDINSTLLIENNYHITEEESSLIIALKNNNFEIVELLLSYPNIDVNSNFENTWRDKETPLNFAIKNNNIQLVEFLLDHPNIDINSKSVLNGNKETPLFIAIKENNIQIVKLLLEKPEIDVNLISEIDLFDKETPLYVAVKNNNIQIVKLLLENPKIDVNLKSEVNRHDIEITPISVAIKNNNIQIVKLLLENPKIDINSLSVEDKIIKGTLYFAVESNNTEIFQIILNNPNIDINSQLKNDHSKDLLLSIAIQNKNIEIVKLLLNIYKNEKVTDFGTSFITAISINEIEFVKCLLSSYPDIDVNNQIETYNHNNKSRHQITYLDKVNQSLITYTFLSYFRSTYNFYTDYYYHDDKRTPLTMALKNNNNEIIKLLLSNPEININLYYIKNSKIETPLNIAIQNGNMEIINLFLSDPKIDVNFTPKYEIKIKWRFPIDIFFCDEEKYSKYEGETALMVAIMNNNLEVVKILLSREDIDVNNKSIYFDKYNQEKTSLFAAVEKGNLEIIKLLLSHPKIDVNCLSKVTKNENIFDKKYIEKAPIHCAVEKGNVEIIQLLISHSLIDINSEMIEADSNKDEKRIQKKTALHIAIENKNIEIIKLLLAIPSLDINSKLNIENYTYTYINKYDEYPDYFRCMFTIIDESINEMLLQEHLNQLESINNKEYQQNSDEFPQNPLKKFANMHKEEFVNIQIKTPIFFAIENNDLETIKLLLTRSDINIKINSEFIEQKTYYAPYDKRGVKYYFQKTHKTIFDIAMLNGIDIINQT